MHGGNIAHILFTRPIVKINVQSKEVQYRQAVLTYKKVMLNAFHEVENALVKNKRTEELADLTTLQCEATQRITNEMEMRYIQGLLPYDRFLTSQENLFRAKKALLSLQMARISSRVELVNACGGMM